MPELPEVETIKRELEQAILNKKIVQVIIGNAKVIKEPNEKLFIKELENVSVQRIIRRGKLLIFELSSTKFLTIHLKMTGQLIYPGSGQNSKVSFKFSDGSLLDFNDSRIFGELRIVKNWQELKFIRELGPEIFDLSLEQFKSILDNKKTRIKILLMDQKIISGIGNLYANEALFWAKIHPLRPANTLSLKEAEELFGAIKRVLSEAIKYGGSSVDQYVRLSGKPGDYARFHRVYNREGEPCYRCKSKIKRINVGGRGTYFCPHCQK